MSAPLSGVNEISVPRASPTARPGGRYCQEGASGGPVFPGPGRVVRVWGRVMRARLSGQRRTESRRGRPSRDARVRRHADRGVNSAHPQLSAGTWAAAWGLQSACRLTSEARSLSLETRRRLNSGRDVLANHEPWSVSPQAGHVDSSPSVDGATLSWHRSHHSRRSLVPSGVLWVIGFGFGCRGQKRSVAVGTVVGLGAATAAALQSSRVRVKVSGRPELAAPTAVDSSHSRKQKMRRHRIRGCAETDWVDNGVCRTYPLSCFAPT